jgi:hypothetical protein
MTGTDLQGMPHVAEQLAAQERRLAEAEARERAERQAGLEAQEAARAQRAYARVIELLAPLREHYERRTQAVRLLEAGLKELWYSEQAILRSEGEAYGKLRDVLGGVGPVASSQRDRVYGQLRAQAGLPGAHESLGLAGPTNDIQKLAVTIAKAICLGYLGPVAISAGGLGIAFQYDGRSV